MAIGTNKPIGSTDPRDLLANAENIDNFANGQATGYPDRFGIPRKSIKGIETQASELISGIESDAATRITQAIINSGYQYLGDYASDIAVSEPNQLVKYDGEYWKPASSTSLPFTTTNWGADAGKFVGVGDAVLREDISLLSGIKDLKPIVGVVQNVKGFYQGSDVGGGQFYYDPSRSKTEHNGGTIIAPEALFLWEGTQVDLKTLLDWTGLGDGCFVRRSNYYFSPECFGAHGKGFGDDTDAFNKAISSLDVIAGIGDKYNVSQLSFSKSNTTVIMKNSGVVFSIPGNLISIIKTEAGLSNITWFGGIVDGNDLGHPTESDSDSNYAPAVGMAFRGVTNVRAGFIKFKNIRGHALQHWNCDGFHFHDINIQANPVRVQTEDGGVRRDGITGSSNNGLIENISGFVDDDLVALLAGADWGLVDQLPQDCYNVQIRNLRVESAPNGRKPWRLLRVMPANGYKMDNIQVSGLIGETAGDPISIELDDRVNKTRGFIGTLTIDDVQIVDPGDDALPNIITRNIISVVGVNIKNLILNNHTWTFKTKQNRVNSRAFFAQDSLVENIDSNNLTIIDERNGDHELSVFRLLCGGKVNVNGLNVLGRDSKNSETYVVARSVSATSSDNSQQLVVDGANWKSPYKTANVFRNQNSLIPVTTDAVIKIANVSPQSDQRLLFTDPICGVVKRSGSSFEQIQPPRVVWQVDGSHLPTADWYNGFKVKLTGSPFGVMIEEIATSGAAPYGFQPIVRDGLVTGFNQDVVLSLTPLDFAPNCTTKMYITDGDAAGVPENAFGLLETKRYPGSYTGLSNCFQFFYPSSGQPKMYIRSYIPSIPGWSVFREL
jgi:hypothetical protein